MRDNLANNIMEIVTMRDVISVYDTRTDKEAGRIKCPFHNGRDNNFSYSRDLYHCFVCGAKGNTISYVAQRFGLSNWEAMQKLDYDFQLGILGHKPSLRVQKRAAKQRAIIAERERKLKRLRILEDKYIDLHRQLYVDWRDVDPDDETAVNKYFMLLEVQAALDKIAELREEVG